LYDAYKHDPTEGNEEFEEVERELENRSESKKVDELEGGQAKDKPVAPGLTALLLRYFSPVFMQCFTMTFVAEWGDRSQIATIALASAKDAIGVTIGGILGHAICTGMAVLGGKLLATRISERAVAAVGGTLFLLFALQSILYPEE